MMGFYGRALELAKLFDSYEPEIEVVHELPGITIDSIKRGSRQGIAVAEDLGISFRGILIVQHYLCLVGWLTNELNLDLEALLKADDFKYVSDKLLTSDEERLEEVYEKLKEYTLGIHFEESLEHVAKKLGHEKLFKPHVYPSIVPLIEKDEKIKRVYEILENYYLGRDAEAFLAHDPYRGLSEPKELNEIARVIYGNLIYEYCGVGSWQSTIQAYYENLPPISESREILRRAQKIKDIHKLYRILERIDSNNLDGKMHNLQNAANILERNPEPIRGYFQEHPIVILGVINVFNNLETLIYKRLNKCA